MRARPAPDSRPSGGLITGLAGGEPERFERRLPHGDGINLYTEKLMTNPKLEELKQAYAEAKAIHREAVKAIVDAKRVADAARYDAREAFGAYMAARPPSKRPRPRPQRVATPDTDLPFPEGATEEVA